MPCSVRGPVERRALRRFASNWAAVVGQGASKSQNEPNQPGTLQPLPLSPQAPLVFHVFGALAEFGVSTRVLDERTGGIGDAGGRP